MKIKTIIFILALPYFVSAQTNSSIDFITGFEFSYRDLIVEGDGDILNTIIEVRKKETVKSNWRIGFNYNRKITNKFHLKSGLRLASVGYKGGKITGLVWGSEIDPAMGGTGMPDPSLPHEVQFVYNYWFIEVPIIGRYEFEGNKIRPFIEAGISPSIYISSRTTQITDIGRESSFGRQKASSFTNLHWVANISFGINYTLNEKMQFFGQPVYRYHLTKLVDAPIKEYLYNFGLEIGLRKRF